MGLSTASLNKHAQAMECVSKLPSLSPLLVRLVQTLSGNTEEISFGLVAEVIEQDTVFAGNVLRVVNSPLYQRRATVQSIRHAIVLLGLAKVRNLALGMSVNQMLIGIKATERFSLAEFNRHSLATATMAHLLTQHLRIINGDAAFLAGLFHDLGRLLIAVAFASEFAAICHLHEHSERSWLECEQIILGFNHAELSADVLATWRFPMATQTAVRYHHSPENDPTLVVGSELRLSQVLNAAELLIEEEIEDGLQNLGLGDRMKSVREQFSSDVKQINSLVS
jgi:HD-like signal output (HDOD) protein